MPRGVWSSKRERQYEAILESCLTRGGRRTATCKRIAAATVNQTRARMGETKERDMAGLRGGGSRRRKAARKTASLTMATIKANNRKAGQHWFDKDTMRFFSSRVGNKVFRGGRCAFFVTSEEGPHGGRKFSVRKTCDRGGRIQTVGDFQAYATRASAEAAAKRLAKQS